MAEEVRRPGLDGMGTEALSPAWGERAECGNVACAGGWLRFLKDRRRPVFEGQWGCSAACVKTMVQAALRREGGDDELAESVDEHRHRMPLGLILLQQGWITQAQLERALYRQRRAGTGRIGRWLTEECGLDPEYVMRGLGLQWGCPVLRLEGFDAQAMTLLAPRMLVESMGMLPLRVASGHRLYVAFADAPDAAAALALERMTGLKVVSGLMEKTQWDAARLRLSGCEPVQAECQQVERDELLAEKIAQVLTRIRPRAARLVRVHHVYWLRMWLESGAMHTRDGGGLQSREDVADRIFTLGREQ